MTPATLDPIRSDFSEGASYAPHRIEASRESEARIAARLDALATLADGWDGEDAVAIDAVAIRCAATLAQQGLQAGLPVPEVFPVPDGGVQLEWRAGPVELELEIEPGGRPIVFVCDDERAGQEFDGVWPDDESRLALALARLHAYA